MTLSSLVLVLVLLVTVSVHGIPRALSAHSAVSISEQELLQLKRASNEAETTFGASSCGAAIALYNLGERERVSGLYAEAAVHLHRAIDLSVNLGCGPGGCAGAASLHSLGAALAATGDPASLQAAMPLLARALRAARAHCGDAAPETIDVLSTQGALAKARGRSSQAIAILRQALQLVEGHAGAPVGGVLTNLGLVLHASGATSDAVATLERAVAMTEAEAVAATTATVTGDGDTAVTPPPLELVQPLQALALALLDAPPSVATDGSSSSSGGGGSSGTGGHVVRAVRLLKRALGILDAHFEGGLHPQHAPVLTALAEALGRGWGAAKAKRRLELLERALQATEARHEELLVAVSAGEASPASAAASAAAVAAAAANVAAVRGESGDVLGQVQALESSAATLERVLGEEHPHVATLLYNLGTAHRRAGQLPQAMEVLQRALEVQTAVYGEDHRELAATLNNLADTHGKLGQHKEQVELLERALAIMEAAVAAEGGSGAGATVSSGTTVVSATGKRVEVLRKRLAALKGLKKSA